MTGGGAVQDVTAAAQMPAAARGGRMTGAAAVCGVTATAAAGQMTVGGKFSEKKAGDERV